jgi:Ni,Fe-hydrogenase III small subunit
MADKQTTYPPSLALLLVQRLLAIARPAPLLSEKIESLDEPSARQRRSVFLRHLDCGSCNGCELELNALSNPIYDSERFGIKFEASPRHADALVLTGAFTRNLAQAADLTLSAMSEPRRIITIGDCAQNGGIFHESYALTPRPADIEQSIIAHVPGCPPTPAEILCALAKLDW